MPSVISGDANVSATEFGYLDGVTSALQTQINGKLATPPAWAAYTPTLTAAATNPNLGSAGFANGRWVQTGSIVHVAGVILFSGTGVSAGSGNYYIELPVASQGLPDIHGVVWMYDSNTTNTVSGIAADELTGPPRFNIYKAGGTGINIAHDNPWTWAAGDQIRFNLTYEAA